MQRFCEEVFDEYAGQMNLSFGFLRQNTTLKSTMYTQFMALVQNCTNIDEGYRDLIMDMLNATDPPDKDFHGRRWLFDYCMRRTEENRNLRAKAKTSQVRKRAREAFHPGDGSQQR
ncbi:hypothetical protein Dda_6918 [Drechslerella dactyloides]|uniref:Uncharacterized protein n=1 Tax=Drechslerella dactyloides TaxID=74499 RepID=A0AAD6ITD1_DREDA|nr:hypothetical protein Dda_6918 [Drechslerella dactyloides]